MIRRDYFLRQAQEMAQVLARAIFLKSRLEYDQALAEIGRALRQLRQSGDDSTEELGADGWIALCRAHETASPHLLRAVADVIHEQSALWQLQGQSRESQQALVIALALDLETLLAGDGAVSAERLHRVEAAVASLREVTLPAGVLGRLARYHETRGRWALTEDALFEWLASGDAAARGEGAGYYARLLKLSDAELERGGLPRAEVEEGQREWLRRALLTDGNGDGRT